MSQTLMSISQPKHFMGKTEIPGIPARSTESLGYTASPHAARRAYKPKSLAMSHGREGFDFLGKPKLSVDTEVP